MERNINESAYKFTQETSNQVDEICKPFVKLLNINNIVFFRTYENGKYICLASNSFREFMRSYMSDISNNGNYFSKEYYKTPKSKIHNYLWPDLYGGNLIKDPNFNLIYKYNMWNGITLFCRGENYVDTLNFTGGPEDTQLRSFFIDNLKILHEFMLYFIFSTSSFLDINSGLSKFAQYSDKVDLGFNIAATEHDNHLNELITRIKIKNFVRTNDNLVVKLSNRERECVYYYASGFTMKEIAVKLDISARTVETHVSNVKDKTGFIYKTNMRELLIE